MFADHFATVGFSGSRSLSGALGQHCRELASEVAVSNTADYVGCASGADAIVRLTVPSAHIFKAKSPRSHHLVGRSVSMVTSVNALPFDIAK